MSNDEQMAIIGRMVLERKQLTEKEVALADEVGKIGEELEKIGRIVQNYRSPYTVEFKLTQEQLTVLDAAKIKGMIDEIIETRRAQNDLNERLTKAGL